MPYKPLRRAIQLDGLKGVRETELDVLALRTGGVRSWDSTDAHKSLAQASAPA